MKNIRILPALILVLVISTAGGFVAASSKDARRIYLFDNHSSSYRAWCGERVTRRTVLHFDGHPDIEYVDEKCVDMVEHAKNAGDLLKLEYEPYELDTQKSRPLSLTNYIFFAWKSGFINRYIWVVPNREPTASNLEAYRRLLQKKLKGDDRSILKLERSGNIITGIFDGHPLTICRFEDLPYPGERVLLDVDVDYFTTRNALDMTLVDAPARTPEELFDICSKKGLDFDIATIALSVEGGYTPLEYFSLGQKVKETLEHYGGNKPASSADIAFNCALSADLDERDKAMNFLKLMNTLSGGFYFLKGYLEEKEGNEIAARRDYINAGKKKEHFREFMLYRGDENIRRRRLPEALACFLHYLDTYRGSKVPAALYKIAQYYDSIGELEKALKYYKSLLILRPGSLSAINNLGICYARRGETKEALACFKKAHALDPTNKDIIRNMKRVTNEIEKARHP